VDWYLSTVSAHPTWFCPSQLKIIAYMGGKNLVNGEEFTDMQINVGSYTAAVEAGSISY
jgi:hypothetical protein